MRIKDALTGQNLPVVDVEVLLSWILGVPRSYLLAHSEQQLRVEEFARLATALQRRRAHEPVAYITGRCEFYGRSFATDKRALIPRGSTEELVRIVVEILEEEGKEGKKGGKGKEGAEEVDTDIVISWKILGKLEEVKTLIDIGTGSGVMGISLALSNADMKVICTDISRDALNLAQENAALHGVMERMEFRQGSCLEPIQDVTEPFLLVSNPPYIVDGASLMKDVIDFEPHVALFGGRDGGDLPRQIWKEATEHPFCRGIVMECMRGQIGAQ